MTRTTAAASFSLPSQAALNLLWSPAFFGLQSPALGLVVIVPLLISILLFIVASWREKP
jgi:benzodiazapine receptor